MVGWARFVVMGLLAAFSTTSVWACSATTSVVAFEPGASGTPDRKTSPPWVPVPSPVVRVASIEPPKSNVPGRCDSYSYAVIEVSVPLGSAFSTKELGFVFRSPVPQDPFLSFPSIPISSTAMSQDGGALIFRFGFEGHGRSVPIEVFAMNKALQVGASTVVVVQLPAI